jgi:hypothetical protein
MDRFRLAALAVAVAAICAACASASAHPYLPCSGQPCSLAIQNDAPVDVAVHSVDSTGRNGALGRVRANSVQVFRVQWLRSERISILVTTREGDHYRAVVRLVRAGPNQVHFPADFTLVETPAVP